MTFACSLTRQLWGKEEDLQLTSNEGRLIAKAETGVAVKQKTWHMRVEKLRENHHRLRFPSNHPSKNHRLFSILRHPDIIAKSTNFLYMPIYEILDPRCHPSPISMGTSNG